MKIFKDANGNEIKVGDVIFHASKSRSRVTQNLGVVTDVSGKNIKYTQITKKYGLTEWTLIKSVIKCPRRSIVITPSISDELNPIIQKIIEEHK